MKTKKPEQSIQIDVFSNLIPLMHLQKYSQFMAFQIRNETGVGGEKGAMIGAFAKAMGTMEGVSDTVFLFPHFSKKTDVHGIGEHGEINVYFAPKTVFVEFKALKPLKTKERLTEDLLSDAQVRFRDRVTALGFEYRIIAATDVNHALGLVYELLRENGVKV